MKYKKGILVCMVLLLLLSLFGYGFLGVKIWGADSTIYSQAVFFTRNGYPPKGYSYIVTSEAVNAYKTVCERHTFHDMGYMEHRYYGPTASTEELYIKGPIGDNIVICVSANKDKFTTIGDNTSQTSNLDDIVSCEDGIIKTTISESSVFYPKTGDEVLSFYSCDT